MINEARKLNEAIDAIAEAELKDGFCNMDYVRNMDENDLKNARNTIADVARLRH